MFFRAIPLIPAKTKLGKLLVVTPHESVPSHLGDDGCCRNGQTPPVTMFDDLLGDPRSNRKDSVNQQVTRGWFKIIHCYTHGQEGSL